MESKLSLPNQQLSFIFFLYSQDFKYNNNNNGADLHWTMWTPINYKCN